MDGTQKLIAKLENIRNLPTLPAVVQSLRKAVRNPTSDARRIAKIIQDDPAMMARILKVVNSALYGAREPVSSLQLAVSRLGLNAVSNIATSTAVFSSFGKAGQKDFDRRSFWRHCIATGITSVVIHEHYSLKMQKHHTRDFLHLAGLLHDIGKILLEQHLHVEFMKAVALSQEESISLIDAEREVFGSDHSQIGAWLGMKWNLPADVLEVVRWHHDPQSANPQYRNLVVLCHLANHICNTQKLGDGGDNASPAMTCDGWAHFGLAQDELPRILEYVNQELENSEVLITLF